MKKAVLLALLIAATACMKKAADGTYRIDNPIAKKNDAKTARANATKSDDELKKAGDKIKAGSREVAQGVKEGAGELAEKAGEKLKEAGRKAKQEVKTDTRR
jgi:hypothetical protein